MTSAEPTPVARRGAKLYVGATLVSQACALLRYVVLARLLGPEQLGLAAALILAAQFFDMATDVGGDHYLVQSKRGAEPRAQAVLQSVLLGRGVLIALLLAALSVPISVFLGDARLQSGLVLLALAPLLMGFQHLDLRRAQRSHDLRGEGTAVLASELCGFAATIVAALLLRDFTAVAWGVAARSLAFLIASHVVAVDRYRLALDREHLKDIVPFALPLMLSGVVLFFSGQGDRVVIGNVLGVTALGHYSAAMLLLYYPSAFVQRIVSKMHFSKIAEQRSAGPARNRAVDLMAGHYLLAGAAMAAGYVVLAPVAVPILFGAEFAQPALLFALIAALQTLRFLRTWPTTVAIADGRSRIELATNLARLTGFPLAYGISSVVPGFFGLVLGFYLGELIAMGVGFVLLRRSPLYDGRADVRRTALVNALLWSLVAGAAAADARAWFAAASAFTVSFAFMVSLALGERHVLDHARPVVAAAFSRLGISWRRA